jgi:hypothetical protein
MKYLIRRDSTKTRDHVDIMRARRDGQQDNRRAWHCLDIRDLPGDVQAVGHLVMADGTARTVDTVWPLW